MCGEFTYTDGWHPTVNPSARMAIHHYRFRELLVTDHGVLNEIPRRQGGCTLRVMRFDGHGGFRVIALPGTVEWVPWWLPATEAWAAGFVTGVYHQALADTRPTAAEKRVYERVLDEFVTGCAVTTALTIGEVLHQVLDAAHRELDPTLPALELTSLTRSPARSTLATTLAAIPAGLARVLAGWAAAERQPIWGMLAVGTSPQGGPLRLRFRASTASFELEPLDCAHTGRRARRSQAVTGDEVTELVHAGRLIPGSRLVALAEVMLGAQGRNVRHFGNTYGRITAAARHLGLPGPTTVTSWPDDSDSWCYAALTATPGLRYPLHLLDVLACTPQARATIPVLIADSLRAGKPVRLDAKESLDASLSAGRARLLWEEDDRPPGRRNPG